MAADDLSLGGESPWHVAALFYFPWWDPAGWDRLVESPGKTLPPFTMALPLSYKGTGSEPGRGQGKRTRRGTVACLLRQGFRQMSPSLIFKSQTNRSPAARP